MCWRRNLGVRNDCSVSSSFAVVSVACYRRLVPFLWPLTRHIEVTFLLLSDDDDGDDDVWCPNRRVAFVEVVD